MLQSVPVIFHELQWLSGDMQAPPFWSVHTCCTELSQLGRIPCHSAPTDGSNTSPLTQASDTMQPTASSKLAPAVAPTRAGASIGPAATATAPPLARAAVLTQIGMITPAAAVPPLAMAVAQPWATPGSEASAGPAAALLAWACLHASLSMHALTPHTLQTSLLPRHCDRASRCMNFRHLPLPQLVLTGAGAAGKAAPAMGVGQPWETSGSHPTPPSGQSPVSLSGTVLGQPRARPRTHAAILQILLMHWLAKQQET